MALRDQWHRVLVYFGLAEEDHEYYGEYEEEFDAPLDDGGSERRGAPPAQQQTVGPGRLRRHLR